MVTGPTIAAGYPKALFDFAVSRGADRTRLVERAGFDPSALRDQDLRTPLSAYIALLDAACGLAGDPALSLRFGEAVPMPAITLLGLIGQTAGTTGEALVQMQRYSRLTIDEEGIGLQLARTGGGLFLVHTGRVYADHPRLLEAALARSVTGARQLFAGTDYFRTRPWPRAVLLRHSAPAYRAEYERIFQAPLVFDAQMNALQIDDDFLTLRLPSSDRYVFGLLSEKAQSLMASLEGSKTMRGRVEAALGPVLHKGRPRIACIAGGLGMSRQTLFRRLKAEGVTFEQVLDALRRELARHYLSGRRVSVNETAYLLGFSDPAAFSRAFKRWTGIAPRTFREDSL